MRVLHVMESTIGGTRRHLADAAREQRGLGADVAVAVSTLREPRFLADLDLLRAAGVRVHDVPMVRSIRPGRDLGHLRVLRDLLRRERPDVVHTHSSKAGVLGRLASMASDTGARVHTPHTFAFLFGALFSGPQRALFRELERGLAQHTARLVAVSATEGDTIRASGIVDPGRVRVVPNGIDPTPWAAARPLPRAALGLPEGAPVGLVAGLVYAAKGQDVALRALTRAGLSELHLLIAGEGDDLAAMQALARDLGVAERAHFLGWREDLPALLATVDLLVLPSRWEGLPYVVLEAQAAGRGVVASAVDGARELVLEGETGFLAAPGDPADLGRALERWLALDPAARRALAERGRALQAGAHSAASMARGLLDVYAEVA